MLELEQGDVWEGVVGLADAARNDAWIRLLRRRAPGARVLELRAGAGVFSVIAARLGARSVVACEPTDLADVARELVDRNGLGDRVAVVEGRFRAGDPVDLVFTTALAGEPFAGGILGELERAASCLAPGGIVAPRRITVRGGLAAAAGWPDEAERAMAEILRWERRYDLDLAPTRAVLASPGPYRLFTEAEDPLSVPTVIWDLRLGTRERPRPRRARADAGSRAAGGAVAWHELELDDGISLGGPPGSGAPWPALVVAWAPSVRGAVRVRWSTVDGRIVATPERTG